MYSFGFQKGKCAHKAMDETATILDTKTKKSVEGLRQLEATR
jgi:hypothetical protein